MTMTLSGMKKLCIESEETDQGFCYREKEEEK